MRWKYLVLFLALLGLLVLSSCIVRIQPPRHKRVRVWYTPEGCRVKRVVFRCYYPYGHLVWRFVRCPGRDVIRTKRVVRRRSCRYYSYDP